jgi:hypothetical protein
MENTIDTGKLGSWAAKKLMVLMEQGLERSTIDEILGAYRHEPFLTTPLSGYSSEVMGLNRFYVVYSESGKEYQTMEELLALPGVETVSRVPYRNLLQLID